MASSSQMQNLNSESASDDYIGDKDSLDTTLEDKLAGGMNYTQEDQFLNLLCDSDKLARSCAETLNYVQPPVGSPDVNQEEMDSPDEDEEGIGAQFTVHNPMTKWSLMKPIKKEIYENPGQLRSGKVHQQEKSSKSSGKQPTKETPKRPMEEMQQPQETMDVPMSTGDVDVEVVNETQTFNVTGTVKDLRQSGYTEDEITRVLADEPVVEKLDDQEDTEDEGIEETQPLVELKEKTRRSSERIILKKLGKFFYGIGSGSGTPVELE
ncbi:hypothetical protein L2E82_01775 [Cichorium intybus]|uniref:Uncharacterized protein n=1 Tax=Cichorium intybus TaxID=13427 RepID=A0ACB9H0G6_CICIN|nr:hypothetical protein L2E82_01775 [Cichorium intybus]